MATLHDRMSLLLEKTAWPAWLGEDAGKAVELIQSAPANTLRMWPSSRRVNSIRNYGIDLIKLILDGASAAPVGGVHSA